MKNPIMRVAAAVATLLAYTAASAAAPEPFTMPLYRDGAPQDNGLRGGERTRDDGFVMDVSVPELTVYLPENGGATGRAVVICPGGGYSGVAMEHEGRMPARWLAERGVAGIVLKYRMPNGHDEVPLADAHRAIGLVRRNAAQWGIDPAKVGVMGFSAGGHLASTASVRHDRATRPDFAVLIYPVVTLTSPLTHSGSRNNLLGAERTEERIAYFSNERHAADDTPPSFIALSDDDATVDPRNSTLYYDALRQAGVAAELHVYPTGGHGWGWRENFAFRDELLTSLARWLKGLE